MTLTALRKPNEQQIETYKKNNRLKQRLFTIEAKIEAI